MLKRAQLSATIIRPSLAYVDAGASSRLFRMLATLPITAMPMASKAKVQPIHVDDLVSALAKLVSHYPSLHYG
ncbi:MAG: hypothetical protein NWQ13_01855 [Glaciimonas sp.]|nr:hypothetical protein [Glaciimonas sp.]